MLARMAIRDWPKAERPREKLLERGVAALSDAELLAILLRTGVAGSSALDLARETLKSFGSLRQLIAADRARFCSGPGLGLARYAELQAAAEISRRQLSESLRAGPLLASPKATRDFLSAQLRDLEHEVFCCLYLDKRHRLIQFEELFRGTIDGANVHPREVVKLALQRNAAAVIVAHNHILLVNLLINIINLKTLSHRYPQQYPHGDDILPSGVTLATREGLATYLPSLGQGSMFRKWARKDHPNPTGPVGPVGAVGVPPPLVAAEDSTLPSKSGPTRDKNPYNRCVKSCRNTGETHAIRLQLPAWMQ
jgi:DNA repair protein RadC